MLGLPETSRLSFCGKTKAASISHGMRASMLWLSHMSHAQLYRPVSCTGPSDVCSTPNRITCLDNLRPALLTVCSGYICSLMLCAHYTFHYRF